MKWTKRLVKWLAVGAALTASGASGAGCLTRPVGQQPPTTKVNFTSTVSQQQVDKVDLLLMIDNSASMGDKQEILGEAVPNLIQGLLKPKCVDAASGKQVGTSVADPNGDKSTNFGCPTGSEPEFKPVTDMHIGIISSSLGSFGGDVCPETGRSNDKGHLLGNVKGGGSVLEAAPSNFLAWFPSNKENTDTVRHPKPSNPTTDITALSAAFQKLVVGVEQTGCGLEAQLESIYRFLVQPDPWVKVIKDGNNQADFDGVDTELLKQRADFLRPDSLVAVIALTDEDDSSADPLTVGGQGWAFMSNQFPGSTQLRADQKSTTAPRPTTACATNPGSPDCTSCGFAATCNASDPACQKIKNDPNCTTNGGYYGATEDQLNVRFHRMKERYGIDPQYPIKRYVDGFTKFKVPDRTVEHQIKAAAQPGGRRDIQGYIGAGKCTNPLFAQKLPSNAGDELCNLQRSTRSSDLIFFAVVGGVPNELLPPVGSEDRPNWNKILGQAPESYNYTGIDSHMIQSVNPRPGLATTGNVRGKNDADPISGGEWDTKADDLQYACTFELPTARTCTAQDTSCDCADDKKIPPLCGATLGQQVRAKAYPTTREFMVVRALNDNGIIASLCPITLDATKKNDPTYGYNPAVAAIINRLKNALTTQCLPQQLTRDETKQVPCLVLAQLGEVTDSCDKYGLKAPEKEILDKFLEQQKAASGDTKDGGLDLSALPVCEVPQITVDRGDTCKDNQAIGWCYVENDANANKTPAGRCPQALIFSSSSGQLVGARFSLQCIQQFAAGGAAGDQK